MKTAVYMNKSKKFPSLNFHAENYAENRDTPVQNSSPGKNGRKKVKFSQVLNKPRKALNFENPPG